MSSKRSLRERITPAKVISWSLVFVFGVIGGLFVSAQTSYGIGGWAIITSVVALAFTGVLYGIKSASLSFYNSGFVQSQTPHYRLDRTIAVLGAVLGILAGIYIAYTTSLHWPFIPLAALLGALFGGFVCDAAQGSYQNSKPTDAQLAIPVNTQKVHVENWKLKRVQQRLRIDPTDQNNSEKALRFVTQYHWMRAFVNLIVPIVSIAVLSWGSVDFAGYRQIGSFFTSNRFNWAFGAAGLVVVIVWVVRNRKRLKQIVIRTAVYTVIIGLIWYGLQMPWAQVISDAFRSGRPLPWLLATIPFFIWGAWRWTKWYYGVIFGTDKRCVECTVMPWPLPNIKRVLVYPATSADAIETLFGNLVGFGHAVLDGAGTLDVFFNNLRYVLFPGDITDSVVKG